MGFATATVGTAALAVAATLFVVRRRIARNWIDHRNSGPKDLDGKVVLITGVSVGGLGYETALDLVRRNATVILACRDVDRGGEAAAAIVRETSGKRRQGDGAAGRVECLPCDLGSLASVELLVDTVTARFPTLYAVVCNAGVWVPDAEKNDEKGGLPNGKMRTEDGFEIHFGVNHLGHVALVRRLMQHMGRSGKEGRFVLVSSSLLKYGQVDLDNWQEFVYKGRRKSIHPNQEGREEDQRRRRPTFAPIGYCDSKLMNALTCRHLAATFKQTAPRLSVYAVSPGFCRSHLGRHVQMPWYMRLMFAPAMLLVQRTTMQGAQNVLFAVLEDRDKLKSGTIYRDGSVAVEETEYMDGLGDDVSRRLWEQSIELLDGEEIDE